MIAKLEVLKQCINATWDGNISSKEARDELVTEGLIARAAGWNVVTAKGLKFLNEINFLKP